MEQEAQDFHLLCTNHVQEANFYLHHQSTSLIDSCVSESLDSTWQISLFSMVSLHQGLDLSKYVRFSYKADLDHQVYLGTTHNLSSRVLLCTRKAHWYQRVAYPNDLWNQGID